MQEILSQKLYEYIRENNPDLLMELEAGAVKAYLNDKVASLNLSDSLPDEPAYMLEEKYLNLLTEDLRPSKYNYLKTILEEEFEAEYLQWQEARILKFEIINLIERCQPSFDEINFSDENEDDPFLKYLIIGTIGEYLEQSEAVSLK